MNKDVIVFGTGGFGQELAEIIKLNKDNFIGFLDDNNEDALGKFEDYVKFPNVEFIIGVGCVELRKQIGGYNCNWYTLIHPNAYVAPSAKIGEGSCILPNVSVNTNAIVGKHCIVNTGSVVEHDCVIEDFVHISTGVKIGGEVKIESGAFLGVGVVVDKNITVISDANIKAGEVVIENK